MSDAAPPATAELPPDGVTPFSLRALDTTVGSLLHRIAGCARSPERDPVLPLAAIYLVAVAATLVPLAIAALASPPSLTAITAVHRLPFLYDWNVFFIFSVSFPCLVVLIVNDHRILAESLSSVAADGTLTISEADAGPLFVSWQHRFRVINHAGQALGLVAGIVVAYFNYVTYVPATVGYWIAEEGRLLPAGYVYLYCIFLFYCLIPLYIVRSAAISLLLSNMMAHARLRMLPMHPDKSGGLRPMGRLGLRNQYLLTLFGLNIVILVAVSFHYLDVPATLFGLIVAAILAYVVLGPLVFIAPLLPFRAAMLEAKTELMAEVARRLRVELQRLRAELRSGPISRDDEELIDRLRKIGAVIDEMPVWPFDAGTLRKFLAAYVVPLLSSAGYSVLNAVWNFAKDRLH